VLVLYQRSSFSPKFWSMHPRAYGPHSLFAPPLGLRFRIFPENLGNAASSMQFSALAE
jgi:hypothetical protein